MKYLYFPGCSQKGTSRAYEESLLAVLNRLGISFEELEDWNCCGTTAIIAVSDILSLTLAARNLALAEKANCHLITPCPSCWLSLTKVNKIFAKEDTRTRKVREALSSGNLAYGGTTRVRHLLEFFINEVGVEKIEKAVTMPLTDLRVAPYYGCQIVRPYSDEDNIDEPQHLEALIGALRAKVAPFELKTACCSGTMMATRADTGREIASKILRSVRQAEANVIVTPCPLCQLNLELAQRGNSALTRKGILPVLNITQLIGLAMGISHKELGLSRSLHSGTSKQIANAQNQRVEAIRS